MFAVIQTISISQILYMLMVLLQLILTNLQNIFKIGFLAMKTKVMSWKKWCIEWL